MKIRGFEDTINWYDKNAESYTKAIQNYSSFDELNEFVSLLPKKAIVLDAGCAAGRDAAVMKRGGIKPIGIDLSSNLIKIAKKRYPKIKFIQGNFLKLPFEIGSFDGVWTHASLLHFDSVKDVKKALSEFY
ncbi:MAG: class I SAM-dependent methyltransferase, partial [Nanoarchaeota archaeon]